MQVRPDHDRQSNGLDQDDTYDGFQANGHGQAGVRFPQFRGEFENPSPTPTNHLDWPAIFASSLYSAESTHGETRARFNLQFPCR